MSASNASKPFDTPTLGAVAENGNGVDVAESGFNVVDGGLTGVRLVGTASVALKTCVALETWVTITARGTVRVTTEDPFRPHPAQLCVSVVKGRTGGVVAVAQTVYVMQDVTTTSCARLVLHMEVYVTVEVTVLTLAAAEPPKPAATGVLSPPSAGAGDGMLALAPRMLRYTVKRSLGPAARRWELLLVPPQNWAGLPGHGLLQLARSGSAPVPASRALAQ